MNFTEKYGKDTEIRALSWKQPFASLMLHGKVETRNWDTRYKGWVLICASKAPYSLNKIKEISGMTQLRRIMTYLPTGVLAQRTGVAIGIGKLVSSIKMDGFSFVHDINVPKNDYKEIMEKKTFVEYNADLWCHSYDEVQPIVPFEWSGVQGWKTLDEETKSKIILL